MKKNQINVSSDELLAVIRQVEAANASEIGHNDHLFLRRIYCEGLRKYVDRLKAIGFYDNQKVLDAGCGYGQWSLALAGLNQMVDSCDISPLRVRFLNSLADQLNIVNLHVQVSGIDLMPYSDNYFDAVFCYGVIFLTPWRKSLAELARVLKPGGRLYVNANDLGWYIFLWQEEHNKADDYDPKAIAAKCFSDTLAYDREGIYEPGTNLIIEQQVLKKELEELGFAWIEIACEGGLHLDRLAQAPKPFFKGEYKGQLGIYEVAATKLA
jgi:SAM-dependent methyltransferase